MSQTAHLHLFEGYGIEMEYMIVDAATLHTRPYADYLLAVAGGQDKVAAGAAIDAARLENEVARGAMAWSNELVMHVVEVKTDGPVATLAELGDLFHAEVRAINAILAKRGARLMPTAMHPLFNPSRETRLWPYGDQEIYAAYDRIFGCQGHGWSNLQSVHINLPFFGDQEFGRLHAAIRLVLPLLPALAASSPLCEGQVQAAVDGRLEFYRHNQRAVPRIAGDIIPEPAFSAADYQRLILDPIYADIAPRDRDGILQCEWLNSRGAIARFDRHAIEIRLLDIQECPAQDAGVVALVVAAVQALAEERWVPLSELQAWPVAPLKELLLQGIRHGDAARVTNPAYLKAFGWQSAAVPTAMQLWGHIAQNLGRASGFPLAPHAAAIDVLVRQGCLAGRIRKAVGAEPSRGRIIKVYEQLCDCLAENRSFTGMLHAG